MEYLSNIILNSFAALILFILLLKESSVRKMSDHKMFTGMTVTAILLLITDSSSWFFTGRNGEFFRYINIFITTIYYLLHPAMLFFWALYADYKIYNNEKRLKRSAGIAVSVLTLFVVFILASSLNGFIFSINQENRYMRGPGFIYFITGFYSILAATLIEIIFNFKKINRSVFMALLFFVIPPACAGIIQARYFGLTLIWPAMSLSILVVFINIQNVIIGTDHLTGIFNRRQIEIMMKNKLKTHNTAFSLIMMDLNDFKKINDIYGHNEGDFALEAAASILRDSIRSCDVIARYAGDEFLVMLDNGSPSGLDAAVNRVWNNLAAWNAAELKPYKLSFSMGFDIFRTAEWQDTKQIIEHADALMYENKKLSKMENRA